MPHLSSLFKILRANHRARLGMGHSRVEKYTAPSTQHGAPMGNGLPPKCGEIIKVKDGAEDRPNEERQKISTHGVPYGWGMARVGTLCLPTGYLLKWTLCVRNNRENEKERERARKRETEIARQWQCDRKCSLPRSFSIIKRTQLKTLATCRLNGFVGPLRAIDTHMMYLITDGRLCTVKVL